MTRHSAAGLRGDRNAIVALPKLLCLGACLWVAGAALPGAGSATSQRTSISLSGLLVDGPDADGSITISGTVEVSELCPDEALWCEWAVYAECLREDGVWLRQPDGSDRERACMVKDDVCMDEEAELFKFRNSPYRYTERIAGEQVNREGLLPGQPRPPGGPRVVPFRRDISIKGQGYKRMRVVARLIHQYCSSSYLTSGHHERPRDPPSWWPMVQLYYWDVSREFDLPGKPGLTVKLDYTPRKPTRHDAIEFVATVNTPGGGPLTYEWYVKEEHGVESQVPAQTSDVYRTKLFTGAYTVRVKVADGPGGPAEDSVSLTVGEGNRPPSVRLVCQPAYPMPGDTITVSALGDDPDGDALEYRFFDMYAGGEITESGEVGYLSPQRIHTKNPARANTAYKVMVVAHDGKGGTARAYIAIAVGEQDTKVYCFAEEGQVTANGQPVPVGTQRQVSEGDVIETSASGLGLSPGRALLNYRGGSQLQVAPGSRLKMGSEGAFLHLEKGGLHGDVPSSVKDVAPTFTTPSAIGTVKGTEFEVTVAEDGATVFRVFDGLVNVSDPDLSKTISLHAGQTTTCQPGSVPADAQPFDHASVDRWWEEAAPPSPAQPGDGNADGRCTEVDALMALKMAVGVQPPDAAQLDVNGDGLVTEVDALQILQWAVKGGHCGGA